MARDTTGDLEAIVRDYPDQAAFALKIRELISRIRREFHGEVREELEQLLRETLQRQATILESRDRSLKALARYAELLDRLAARLGVLFANADPKGRRTIH